MSETNLSSNPLVGVSACLMGREVRYDGGHKRNQYILNVLSDFLDFSEVCPESEAGFGTPRPAMHLQLENNSVRLVLNQDHSFDLTSEMDQLCETRIPALAHLDGFIFKKDSPSCGVFRVAVTRGDNGYKERTGRGLFAQAFMAQNPLIPVEEEGRLNDPDLRANFLERVFAWQRWKAIDQAESLVQDFIGFHSRHKLLLMSRGSSYYQELGRMVAGVTRKDLSDRRARYIARFMEVMARKPRRGQQVNVLQHIMGYLKEDIATEDKQELLQLFEQYRQQRIPLITPITLLRHHLRKFPQPYITQQHYLEPYPEALALRSVL